MELNQPTPPLERRRVVVPDRAQSCRTEGFSRQQLKRLENRTHRDDSRLTMKSQLIAIVAAVLVVGCKSTSIHKAAGAGNIEAVKQHLAAGVDVNAKDNVGKTPLDWSGQAAINAILGSGVSITSITAVEDFLRKHGGKTGEELKAEGK